MAKNTVGNQMWALSTSATYANSNVNTWLNNTWLPTLEVASKVKQVTIPTNGTTMSTKVFLLSGTEVGLTSTTKEGATLGYFKTDAVNRRIANAEWFTRTVSGTNVVTITADGAENSGPKIMARGVRPAFILPN